MGQESVSGYQDIRRPTQQDYVYTPLETADYIRIIELLPSQTEDDRVCCRMHHKNLVQPPLLYTAISYVWGDDSKKAKIEISCDGGRAMISPNLHSALVRLRNTEKSIPVWADALCINQALDANGLAEKEQQVRMMDRIFARAERVMIDLGSTPAPEILSILDRFYNIPEDTWGRNKDCRLYPRFQRRFSFSCLLRASWRAAFFLAESRQIHAATVVRARLDNTRVRIGKSVVLTYRERYT